MRKVNYFTYMDKAAGTAVAKWAAALPEGLPAFYVDAVAAATQAMKENVKKAMKTFAFMD